MEIYYVLLVYVIYILLPLIPAIIIYKLFPDTSVGTSGVLGNLKINATGAFAAYIITVILGNWVIASSMESIRYQNKISWEVSAEFEFTDEDGNLIRTITKDDVIRNFKIKQTTPSYESINTNSFVFMVYGEDDLPSLLVNYPGFQERKFNLNEEGITKKYKDRKINLGKIILIENDKPYEPETSQASTNDPIVPRLSGGPATLQKDDETSN